MKKLKIMLAVALALAVLPVILRSGDCGTDESNALEVAFEGEAVEPEYELKLYEGRLFLYKTTSEGRFLVRREDAPSLREKDISLLAEGITVASLTEALALLEDFTS